MPPPASLPSIAANTTSTTAPSVDLYCKSCGGGAGTKCGSSMSGITRGTSELGGDGGDCDSVGMMLIRRTSTNSSNSIATSASGLIVIPDSRHMSSGGATPGGAVATGASRGDMLLPVAVSLRVPRHQWRDPGGHSLWSIIVCVGFAFFLLLAQCEVSTAHPSPQYNGHYSNNDGHHGHLADEEYDEPEVFRLRGRHVTDTAYLTTFGYLPQSDFETGAMRTQEEMSRAIRRFQNFANLPLTGKFDEKTRAQMSKPRCGLPDIIPTKRDAPTRRSRANHHTPHGYPNDNNQTYSEPEVITPGHKLRHKHGRRRVRRYELSDAKWETTQLTFRILNHSPDLAQKDVRRAIYRALKLWSDVTFLNFREKTRGDADIMIRFAAGYHGDGYSFDGPGLILAHAFFPGPDRGGDVHFDEDETWTAGTDDGTNLFIVAAHEIGHALGLSHSAEPGSLMFPWYQGYQPEYRLPNDDIAGIQAFYGAKYVPPHPASTLSPGPGGGTPPPSLPTTTFKPVTRRAWTTTTPLPTPPTGNVQPDSCQAVIDAISIIRGEIFAFSGKWFWRVDGNGVMKDYPVEISRFWYGFPKEVDRIDAVYEQFGGKIVFFRGARYWTFNGNHMIPNFPKEGRPIEDIGLPADLDHVDAAFQWGYNKLVYIISGFNYWRFNVHENKVEADYPRDMSMWGGVPLPVGAAFQFWDGRTYFFQGTQTWCFSDVRMAVRAAWPKHTGETFLDCKRQMKQGFEADHPDHSPSTGGAAALTSYFLLTVAAAAVTTFRVTIMLGS